MSSLLSRSVTPSAPLGGFNHPREFDSIAEQIGRWDLQARSPRTVVYLERTLRAMNTSAFAAIRDTRLRVVLTPRDMIWAYFPVHKRRWIVRWLPYPIGPGVKVLLVVGEDSVMDHPKRRAMAELAHHFGHALCYLRNPGWIHTCADANRAARKGGLSQFLLIPRDIYGRRKRDFSCGLSESTLRRKLQRLEELNRA